MRLIIFDCDGTLLDSQASIMRGIEIAWNNMGLTPPKLSDVLSIVGLSIEDSIKVLEPSLTGEKHQQACDELLKAFEYVNKNELDDEELYPNVIETLNKIKTNNSFLAILTGKGRLGLDTTLKKYQMGDLFAVTKTADCGAGKPNPQTMLDIIYETGVDKENTVMIGDTSYDILTAKNAGVKSIGVSFGYHSVDELKASGADKIVDNFSELPNAIDELIGA